MILREIRDLLVYHSRFVSQIARHDHDNVFGKAVRDLTALGFGELRGKSVLDLGCGQRFPFALQCSAQGMSATALDINYVKPDAIPLSMIRILRHNGLRRMAKSTLRRVLYDRTYYQALETAAQEPVRAATENVEFVIAEPTSANYPLVSDSFDLVVSNAVVEHVEDLPRFAGEVRRLLKSGGYFHAIIHNYYSVSGGHNMEWAYPDQRPSNRVAPWDHLRENLHPGLVYLNKMRPEEYRAAFEEELEVLVFEGRDVNHDAGGVEGEQFLTPEVATELKDHSRDLLLTRSWCVIARKR